MILLSVTQVENNSYSNNQGTFYQNPSHQENGQQIAKRPIRITFTYILGADGHPLLDAKGQPKVNKTRIGSNLAEIFNSDRTAYTIGSGKPYANNNGFPQQILFFDQNDNPVFGTVDKRSSQILQKF